MSQKKKRYYVETSSDDDDDDLSHDDEVKMSKGRRYQTVKRQEAFGRRLPSFGRQIQAYPPQKGYQVPSIYKNIL